jgi:hypothetical protein
VVDEADDDDGGGQHQRHHAEETATGRTEAFDGLLRAVSVRSLVTLWIAVHRVHNPMLDG